MLKMIDIFDAQKPTVWARQNKGVNNRAARDMELEAISKPTIESSRAALERKAKIYDMLKKGKSGGLSDAQYEALLVDVRLFSILLLYGTYSYIVRLQRYRQQGGVRQRR
jgi:hypothetical protein